MCMGVVSLQKSVTTQQILCIRGATFANPAHEGSSTIKTIILIVILVLIKH